MTTKVQKKFDERLKKEKKKVDKINKELTNGSVTLESLDEDAISSDEETDD